MAVGHWQPAWSSGLGLGVALIGLNLALSFHNLWPTPWITTRNEISIEIVMLVMVVAVIGEFYRLPSRRALTWLALLLVLFVIGRYLEVAAPALYGRPINLYFDATHLPQVATMLTEVLPAWQIWLLVAGILALLILVYLLGRWLLTALVGALADSRLRRFAIVLSVTLVVLYTAGQVSPQVKTRAWFSLPVSMTFAKQFHFLYEAIAGEASLDAAVSPLPHSHLHTLSGSDVLILFLESYGVTTLDHPEFAQSLASNRAALADAVQASGRQVVSARVTSPTFGGASWLAHSSFLSGIEVRDNYRYQLLLTQVRDTLVHRFSRQGYRTVGLMPGLRKAWPEGAFYGFDQIYDASSLSYPGPAFGWWRIPDQYALAQLDNREIVPEERPPLLAVMHSISSHAPFHPLPPYQKDWTTLLGPRPYHEHNINTVGDGDWAWTEMGRHYVRAVAYVLTYLTGYVEHRAQDDLVLIAIGDHQPPASVSGPDAPWEVPVHVIARNPALIAALRNVGFDPGLEPTQPALGPMHDLAAQLLRAFDAEMTVSSARIQPVRAIAGP